MNAVARPGGAVPLVLVFVALLVGRLVDVDAAGRVFVISAVDLVAVGIAVVGAVIAYRRGTVRVDPALVGYVGLVAVVGLQLIGGDDRAAMIGGSSRIVVPALVLFGLSQLWTPSPAGTRGPGPTVITGFGVVVALWVGVLAVQGAFDPANIDFYDFKTDVVMPLGASNYLAAFLLVSGVMSLAMVVEDRRYLAPTVVIGLGLAATLSRGAFLAAIVAVVALAILRLRPRLARVVVIALGVVVVATVVLGISDYASTGQSTVDGRLRLWAAAWDGFARGPLLGVGYNDLLDVTASLEQMHPNAHNLLLHSLATTGILGAGAYLWLWGTFATRLLRATPSPRRDALFAAGAALFMHAQIEALAYTRAVEVLLAVLLVGSGLLVASGPAAVRTIALRGGAVAPE